ncbi:hypothetical protein CSE6_051_50650, partial [Comamonas sp. E6]
MEKLAKTLCYNFCIAAEKHCFIASGGIAQLGERLHGMQEVIGSIPFTSTKINDGESQDSNRSR